MNEINPNNDTLTFVVKNNSEEVSVGRIFGANKGLDEFFNAKNNVSVTLLESSHMEIKAESMQKEFCIDGMLIQENSNNVEDKVKLVWASAFGMLTLIKKHRSNYRQDNQGTEPYFFPFDDDINVNGAFSIELELAPLEELRIVFKAKNCKN